MVRQSRPLLCFVVAAPEDDDVADQGAAAGEKRHKPGENYKELFKVGAAIGMVGKAVAGTQLPFSGVIGGALKAASTMIKVGPLFHKAHPMANRWHTSLGVRI